MQEGSEVLRNQFHAFLSLCFVPPDDVPAAFLLLRDNCEDELDDVATHLENNYVLGRRWGRGRRAPMFAISKWNLYARVLAGVPKTNNTCEAWNARFNALIGKKHPNLFEFLDSLRKEELYAESRRRGVDLGNEPPKKKRKYLLNDVRISRIVGRYAEYKAEQDEALEGDWDSGTLKYLLTLGHSGRGIFV